MRHAFVPMTNGSDRCARCLRHLDCVPHLPIAPGPTWPEPGLALRRYMSTGIPRHAERLLAAKYLPRAVSRAAR